MAQRDVTPCERRGSFLEDGPREESWQESGLISNYHALGPSALSAATLYCGKKNRAAADKTKKR